MNIAAVTAVNDVNKKNVRINVLTRPKYIHTGDKRK